MNILETTKQEFLNELENLTSISGSLYTRRDVGQIIGIFVERVMAVEPPVTPVSTPRIGDELIDRLVEIAETFAVMHAQNCAENYDFSDVEFNTNEYRGELTVTADVNVDSHTLSRSATFRKDHVKTAIKDLLTPNTPTANA